MKKTLTVVIIITFSLFPAISVFAKSLEEEKALKSGSGGTSGEIIGEWIDESIGQKYTLLRRSDKIFMIRKFKDGPGFETEMVQKKHPGGLRFEEKRRNDFGEYYLIESNGNMGIYDYFGLFNRVRSIK